MNSRASLINGGLIKSDFKRFWWLGVLNAICSFFSGTFIVMSGIMSNSYSMRINVTDSNMFAMMMVGMIITMLTTVRIMAYLNSGSAVAFAHSLPLRRSTQYFSHLTSVLLMSLGAGAINAILMLLYRLNGNVAKALSLGMVFRIFAAYMVYSVLMICLTAFVTMITGNSISCIIFTLSFVCIPMALEAFILDFVDKNIYGFSKAYSGMLVERVFYLTPDKLMSWSILIYIALAAAGLLFGLLLYKHRSLECNGEVVAFVKSRPIFIYTVALFAGIGGYIYLECFYDANIFFMLPFGIFGIIIAYMLSRKSFNLKGVHVPIIIFTLFVVALFLVVRFDLTGYERKIPELSSIESVEFKDMPQYEKEGYYTDGPENYVYYDDVADLKIKDTEDINGVISFHKHMIENRQHREGTTTNVPIIYHLQNGKTLERAYSPSPIEDQAYLSAIFDTEEYRGMLYELADGTEKKITSVRVSDDRLGNYYATYYQDDALAKELTDAVIKDMKETAYEDEPSIIELVNAPMTRVEFTWTKTGHYKDGRKADTQKYPGSWSYSIPKSYVNTWRVLDKIGLTAILPTADDIIDIGVDINGEDIETKEMLSKLTDDTYHMYKITNKEQITQIYDYVTSDNKITEWDEKYSSADITIIFNNGFSTYVSLYCAKSLWPEAIAKLAE